MKITLKPADKSDLKRIFEWRNHPLVRGKSFNTGKISWGEHVGYWKKRLCSKGKHSLIVVADGNNTGLIRLDRMRESGDYEVSIMIDPAMHGKGVGTTALKKTKEFARKKEIRRLHARIKAKNIGSIKAFEAAGFKPETYDYVVEV